MHGLRTVRREVPGHHDVRVQLQPGRPEGNLRHVASGGPERSGHRRRALPLPLGREVRHLQEGVRHRRGRL